MAFDVAAARKAGYSNAEIAEFLGQQKGFDAAGAMKAGYSPDELIAHLAGEAPKTTAFGQVKEGFKGVLPGAIGLLESAATGASALLPEDMEKSAREKIKSVATSAKEPFAAAPGYEDTIGRKLGEAVGSTVPFLAAGPLGLAGRAAAVSLGVGAGAGEARTRAEAEGATADQRGTATALGTIPGALEAFAPIRILSRIPTASKAAGVEAVKRAMIAGGEEAAQEAASGFAQNLIARGVYKPEQALIEGLGEQAAYGGATGAIVQGLMDLALGRRARGAQTTPGEAPPAEPITAPQLPLVTAPGTQGALFTEEEMGKVVKAPAAEAAPAATPGVPAGQQDLGLDFQREYADMALERERLRMQPQTPEVQARMAELGEQMALYTQSDIESLRAQKEGQAAAVAQDAATRERFPGLANAPDLLTQSDEVKARTQGELFPGEDLGGRVPTTAAETKPTELGAPTPVPAYSRRGPYQYKLPLRGGAVAEPFTLQNVMDTGIALSTTKGWFEKNVVGKTQGEVQALVDKDPTLVEGPGKRAKILRELLAPQPAPFKETPRVEPTPTETPAVEQRAEPGTSEPSVGVPSEPTAGEPVEPGGGLPTTAGEPVAPDGLGLVPAGQPAVQGDEAQGRKPTAVTETKEARRERLRAEKAEREERTTHTASIDGTPVDVQIIRDKTKPLYNGTYPVVELQIRGLHKQPITMPYQGYQTDAEVLAFLRENENIDDTTAPAPKVEPSAEAIDEDAPKAYEKSPAVVALSRAKTKPQLESALDEIARIRRNPGHPEHEAINEFLTDALAAPGFEPMFAAALDRTRQRQAPTAPKAAATDTDEKKPRATKPIRAVPAAFYEPVGIDRRTGKVIRGKQMLVQPIDDKRAAEYLKAKARADEGDTTDLMALFEEIEQEGEVPDTQGALFDAKGKATKEATVKAAPEKPSERFSVASGAGTATDTQTQLQIVKELEGKNILEAAVWAANKSPDQDQRMIAMRVAATLRELQAIGVVMGPLKITPDGQKLLSGARGVTVMQPGPNKGPSTIRVTLNHPSNGDQSGVGYDVILHELVHAATMGATRVGNRKAAANTRIGKAVSDLYDVANAVFAHVDAKHARGETLNDVEQKLRTSYMRDVDEVLAWTMTDRNMQKYMETVPYKGSNLWTQFVQAVRNVLGLQPKADTALSEILRVGEELTASTATELADAAKATGMQFSVAPGTEALIDSLGPLDPQEKSGVRKLIDGFKDQTDLGYATKFRTQTADAAATIEHRLREQFDGAVKDKLGKFNPMGLYRQAQDYSKMLLEYLQVGAIAKEPATGLWKVKADPKTRPPVEVYALIDKWAAKNGYSRERGTQIASRILEGVRLDAMRASNKNDGTSFLLHMKDNEIDQLVREYKADPDLQAMSKAMDSARLAMVDNMVAVGRLSAEQGQVWKDAAGYVPFDRIDDFATSFTKIKKISNKGLAQVGKLPELVGSINRPVGNVFDNYLNTLGWMVGQTLKTDGTVQTLRSLEDAGHAKYLGRSTQNKENTVGMYVKGEMMYWELPSKYDVLAFKDLNPPKAKWLQVLGQASNVLRKAVTILPPFALKQVTDDVQRAIMTSGVRNPGALLRMTLSNFGGLALAELRGIQHPTVRQFGALGLTGEYDFQQGKPAQSVLKDLGYKPRGKFETLLHRLDGITRASDLAVRKAIYDQTLKESQGDELLAQTRAREFINFRRRGASDFVGAMVTTIPFFNAYIQGMDVLYRAASGKDSSSSVGRAQARQMFWGRAAIVMALSSLYAAGAGDDEDYNEMDLRTRDSNWILPGGFKIPVPTELGALFKVVPERVVEYMRRQGTPEEQTAWEATRTALTYIMEQYVGRTVPVPQGVKPLLEAWTNYSFFTGRELEGIYQKQQDPSMRRASNTSELAIAISEFSRDVVGVDKVSPILIDNALNGYFGSSAGLLVAMTDSLLNPTRVDRPLHKWALVSNYMYDPVGTRRMTEFYEEREKVGRANTTLNELMKTDLDRAAAYAEEHADELMLESAVNSTLEQLERTRAYRKYLNSPLGAEDMSKEEREASLKEVKQMEIDLTRWLREAKTAIRQ